MEHGEPGATKLHGGTGWSVLMKFGVCVATNINDWQLLVHAENQGFDRGWVPDSQMIWSDCYAVLALAAHHTSRIRLGTGVAIAGTRIAPVTAHSIASINRIAPGRVFLGIGTGHTAMRVMNFNPMKAPPFREYLRVVRALLDGKEVAFTLGGETRTIEIIHKELGFVDTEHRNSRCTLPPTGRWRCAPRANSVTGESRADRSRRKRSVTAWAGFAPGPPASGAAWMISTRRS